MKKTINTKEFIQILNKVCDDIETNKDYFSELDRAIGDGDHGVTMSIGWNAIKSKLNSLSANLSFDKICMQIATSFLSAVGASAGPLYATALIRGGAAIKDKMEINAKELSLFFTAAAKGIQERGKAELGDKTMLDVWMPSAKKIEEAVTHSDDIISVMEITSTESTLAMNATKDMQSKKGRSSKLGERSIGFIDPGAASSQMIIKSFYETIKKLD
tara:strand:- start:283 stop:930 length:648 start_codon:yes stop_codon:yes gene_type:complete